jgi:hypothetical protein
MTLLIVVSLPTNWAVYCHSCLCKCFHSFFQFLLGCFLPVFLGLPITLVYRGGWMTGASIFSQNTLPLSGDRLYAYALLNVSMV